MKTVHGGIVVLLVSLFCTACEEAKKPAGSPLRPGLEDVLRTLLKDPMAFRSTDPDVRATGDPVEPFIGAGVSGIELIRRRWPDLSVDDAYNFRTGGPPVVSSRESTARLRLLGTISYVGIRTKNVPGAEATTVMTLIEIAERDPNPVLRGHALSTLALFSVRDRDHLRRIVGMLGDDAPSADRGSSVAQVAESVLLALVSSESRPITATSAARRWSDWLEANESYLFFKEDDRRFAVSLEAKAAGIPADPVTGRPLR